MKIKTKKKIIKNLKSFLPTDRKTLHTHLKNTIPMFKTKQTNKQTYNWGKEFCAVLHKVDISPF